MSTRPYVQSLLYGLQKMSELKDIIRDTHGNLSVMAPGGVVCIKPSGMVYESISVSDVVLVAVSDGEILSGKRKPSVDLNHHLSIYRKYPHIGAICHTHSPYATAHAMVDMDIPVCCTEQADYFGHHIRTVGSRPDIDSWGEDLLLEPDEKAVLLRHHGALTFGGTAGEAVNLAAALENIAQKHHFARTLAGGYLYPMDSNDVRKWHERYQTRYGQK